LNDDLGLVKVKLAKKLEESGEIYRDNVSVFLVMSFADLFGKE
jgi:hypothetical protein